MQQPQPNPVAECTACGQVFDNPLDALAHLWQGCQQDTGGTVDVTA